MAPWSSMVFPWSVYSNAGGIRRHPEASGGIRVLDIEIDGVRIVCDELFLWFARRDWHRSSEWLAVWLSC